MKPSCRALAVIALLAVLGRADAAWAKDISLVFATAAQGREILTARDTFVKEMSPFDRAGRLKTDRDVSEDAYLKFVGDQVLEWTDDEKAFVQAAIAKIQPRLDSFSLPWPEPVYLVKTTGMDEGHVSYTRANAIILPVNRVAKDTKIPLNALIAHELFHVLSRKNPELRKKLYAAIGFYPCGDVAFPPKLKDVKITNPDDPKNDYCIRVKIDNAKAAWVTPIIFSQTPKYDAGSDRDFFDYMQYKFLKVDGDDATAPFPARYDTDHPQLLDIGHIFNYFDQIGWNTSYVIAPDEILADNFSFLITEKKGLPSPEIQQKMQAILENEKTAR